MEFKSEKHAQALKNWDKNRGAGVLLHVSSLPSKFGIGDLGPAGYDLADKLVDAGQAIWQILPLNPTNAGAGESPYFSSSAFAGNPLLVDLVALQQEGLLDASDLDFPNDLLAEDIEFARVRPLKLAALRKAAKNLVAKGLPKDFTEFTNTQAYWLDDYARFNELERMYPEQSWCDWPEALRDRHANAMAEVDAQQADAILETKVFQYFFFRQWEALKAYCNEKGLLVFGDMPIYVSYDSSDVWANPDIFKLDDSKRPTMVSGVPPDYFSETDQLWNNPVYNWPALQKTNYDWWVKRMGALFERFDIVRIDHFRGLVQFWEVPAGSENAINGSWQDVPTREFFDVLKAAYPEFPVVAEDLGIITPDVVEIKDDYALPGMLVLHFAFGDDTEDNPYKPHNHGELALVYLGTHDNDTTEGWIAEADHDMRRRLGYYLEGGESNISTDSMMNMAMSSKANLAILTAQDLLKLPTRARINNPATPWDNWSWRLTQAEYDAIPWEWLKSATEASGRSR